MSWKCAVISNVAEVFNGKTPSKEEQRTSGHPVLKIKDVDENGSFKGNFESFVDLELSRKFEGKKIKYDDSLILNAAHNSDYVGSKQYRAEEAVVGALPTGEWLVVRAVKDKLHPRFLNHWLSSGDAKFKIKQLVKGIHLYPKDVARLEIPLPPLEEQKRIAAVLDKADAIRRKRQQAIKLADDFLRSVFLEMFGDPVTNPKGWDVKKLSDFTCITTGNTPSRAEPKYYGDYIEWIKSDNINTPSHFLTKATEYLSLDGYNVSRTVPAGSTLVTCIAGSFDCIGNAAYTDREVAFNQQINALTPKDGTNSWFLYALILLSKKAIQAASTNSMKGMLSKGRMEEIELIVPDCIYQEKFGQIFSRYLALTKSLETTLDFCGDLFNSSSKRAFQGNL